MTNAQQLLTQRAALVERAKTIVKNAESEGREQNTEERAEFEKVLKEAESLHKRARDIETTDRLSADLESSEGRSIPPGVSDKKLGNDGGSLAGNDEVARKAFRKFLKSGNTHGLTGPECRALNMGENDYGGFLVPPRQVASDLVMALHKESFLLDRMINVETVTSAASLGVPTIDAKPTTVIWSNETGGGVTENTETRFGMRELKPNPARMLAKISKHLMRLSTRNPETIFLELAAIGFAQAIDYQILNGTGAGRPLGVMVASNDGIPTSRDVVSGSNTALTYDGLLNFLTTSVRPVYRKRPTFGVVAGTSFLNKVLALKDSQNRPIFVASTDLNVPDRVLGVPIYIHEDCPDTWTAGLYTAIAGDWSYYRGAAVAGFEVQILNELYALSDQVGYWIQYWFDGMPVLAEAFSRLKSST